MSITKEYIGQRVTFRQLFDHHPHVEIPIIQRDYAQGRETAFEMRSLFLDALHMALMKTPDDPTLPLDLDFVYGSLEGENKLVFCPLDGQQRLTTLFLLHWYLAWVDDQSKEFAGIVNASGKSRFAYAVRSSSGEFVDTLAGWSPQLRPDDVPSLGNLIDDQPWFFQWWKRDPTIQSALAMLDAIHLKFRDTRGFYNRLTQSDAPYITFQLLDLDNFGLSDDLYIKMNARGKPLTDFESFKALVEKHIGNMFPEPNVRQLFGKPATLKDYFSHQIDTTWAELFWAYRHMKTNLFDGQIMNLIRATGIITRNPDGGDIDEVFEALRSPSATLSFQKYIDNKCLDRPHVELVITLLDALSGATGRMRTHLPDSRHFDEGKAFSEILEEGGTATYAALIQFCAYAEFFRVHGISPDSHRFCEWMRVVRNLTINSNIERPIQFKRSLRSVIDLLKHSGRILAFLAVDGGKIEGFSIQQIREERIKAALILKSDRWKDAILRAECHGYFNGQIEFLLDFCGVLNAWNSKPSCDWSATEDDEYHSSFVAYTETAQLLFNDSGLIALGDLRTERALLAIGDYTFEKGQNRSILEDLDDPISWKRLLRGEQVQKAGRRRDYVKQLLDKIDVVAGVKKSLDDVIRTTAIAEDWRRLLVVNPKMLEYCEKRQFRYYSDSNVYLLKGVRRSGEHVELYSYNLYLGTVSEKSGRGELAPFRNPTYNKVHTDSFEPSITLSCVFGKVRLVMQIWNIGGKYRMRFYAEGGEIPASVIRDLEQQAGFEVSSDGKPQCDVAMDKIEACLESTIGIVRAHVAV